MNQRFKKRFARLTAGLTLGAMLSTGCFGTVPVVNAAENGDSDLAQGKDVVMMADCPVVNESTVRNNPRGSNLKVNDGDDSTGWLSSNYDACLHSEHWLYADFITPKTFDEVKIVWADGAGAASYKIQVSNTGRDADWYDVAESGEDAAGEKESVHKFESTTARYVRVYIEDAQREDDAVGIQTFSVFQRKSAPDAKDAVEKDLEFLTEDCLKSTNTMLPEITNTDLKNVKASLNLPQTGFASSDISWNVAPDDGGINVENGEVIRGAEDKNYKLTATVSKGDVSQTKEFDVTVKANVVTGAELVEGENGHNYLTANGEPLPYINVQNCGMQHYILSDLSYEEQLAEAENLFEKTAALGYRRIGIIFKWKDFEPTNAGEYDWRVVDKYIEWCNKYDLYWDIVYFGSNSCGGTRLLDGGVSGGEWWMGNLPTYVDKYKGYFDNGVHSGAPMVKCPVLKGPNYEWIKTNEIRAVQDLMNHIAEVDTNKRTACFQVMNEPYWHEMSRPYWQGNWSKNNEGEDRWVYDWISDMAVAIKASDYAIPTRINGSLGAYSPDQYTWLNDLPGIDFMGDDSYNSNVSVIEDNIVKNLAGSSFPHIAENNGRYSNTSSLVITCLINGGGYHTWELPDDQGQGMAPGSAINWELGVPAEYYESGQDMGRFNPSVNKIGELVATAPVENMKGFNIDQNTPIANYKETTQIQGIYVGYECDDASVAMAVKDDKAVYLATDSASDGSGNVNFLSYEAPVSASYGEMNENGEWVVSQELEAVQGSDGIYRVPVKSGECIRLEFDSAGLPQIQTLTVSDGTMEPEFNTYVHEYDVTVDPETEELSFTAGLNEESASFEVDGLQYNSGETSLPVALSYGETEIKLNVVWDALGQVEENTYTFRVHRETPDGITAEDVAKSITKIPELSTDADTAAFIPAVEATAGSQWDNSIAPVNVINNSGMSGTSSFEDTHDAQGTTAWHTRPVAGELPGKDAWIQIDLGKTYALDEMWIWNMNQSGLAGRGLKNVKIEYSVDGEEWKELAKPEDMEFEDGDADYPFQFAQATGQPGLKATNLNDGENSPVSFGGKKARYVKITANPEQGNGSWGEQYFGLSEVRFTEYQAKQGDIVLPAVPGGFEVSIEKSGNEKVIDLEGNVTPDTVDRVVMLTLRVTNKEDEKDTALTKPLPVKVYSKKDSLQNVNLALNKPVIDLTAGETGERASNAVDGNYLTRYVSSASIQSNPASFTVDLGEVMEFNQMVTVWESARVSKYSLSVSEDKKTWKEVIPETDLDHDGTQVDNFETVSGRYVRFNALKNGPNAGVFAIAELEIYNRRLISEDYILRDLTLSAGTLSPEFNSDVYSYDVVVGSETDSLTVTPKQNGADAEVEINGKVVKNGQASDTIPLETGENLITVRVQDPDSKDSVAVYEIHVNKKDYSTEGYGNVLLNKTVTWPGYGGGFWHEASKINDGDRGNYAQPNGGIADYQFDLGGVYAIDEFRVFTGTANYITDFDLKVSLDGTNWTTVQQVKGYTPTSAVYQFDRVNARYVLLDNIAGAATAAINEVEAYGSPVEYNAAAIADNIRSLEVTVGQTQITLPDVPEPYSVQIKSSSNEAAIGTDGTITATDAYQEAELVLEVFNTENAEDKADTRAINVVVPPMNLTCKNVAESIYSQIDMAVPKDVTLVALPVPPAGFTAEYTYIEGDKELLSFDGNTMTVHPQRSNSSANYSLTVSNGEDSYTCEAWLRFTVEGRSATAQEMADELVVENVQQCGGTLALPEMPEGYKLEIMSSTNQGIIDLVGNIAEIDATTDVDIYLKVTRLSDHTTAVRSFTITVLSNVDRSALDDLIGATAGTLKEGSKYTAETFRAFVEAYREAKRVSAEISSDQAQVDAAKDALQAAFDALEEIRADKTALQALFDECKDITEQGDYTDETWAAFTQARDKAEEILNKEDATQEEVDSAMLALLNARLDLAAKVNVELLVYVVSFGESIDTEGCTPESVKALEDALQAGKEALKDEKITEEQVAEHVKAILDAVAGLEQEEAPETGDTSSLEKLVEAAGNLTEEKYTPATWSILSEALEQAEAVLEKSDAAQEEIDKAFDALLDAVMKLENRAEKSGLQLAVDTVKGILADKDSYVESTLENMEELLKDAEAVLADENASQSEVNDMTKTLSDAAEKAKKQANKEGLKAMIEVADKIDTSLYTEESAEAFSTALKNAKEVMDNKELSVDEQQKVDDALDALVLAMDQLVLKPDDGGETGDGENPGGGDQTGDGNQGGGGQTGNGSQDSGDQNGSSQNGGQNGNAEDAGSLTPQTGDSGSVMIWIVMAAAAAVSAVLAYLFRYRKSSQD